jgi:hypothetical protein
MFTTNTDAFLRVGRTLPNRTFVGITRLFAEEYGLELVHSGVGEQQSWVVEWHYWSTRHNAVAFSTKKFKEIGAYLLGSTKLHIESGDVLAVATGKMPYYSQTRNIRNLDGMMNDKPIIEDHPNFMARMPNRPDAMGYLSE